MPWHRVASYAEPDQNRVIAHPQQMGEFVLLGQHLDTSEGFFAYAKQAFVDGRLPPPDPTGEAATPAPHHEKGEPYAPEHRPLARSPHPYPTAHPLNPLL